jgi:hypothetical protein
MHVWLFAFNREGSELCPIEWVITSEGPSFDAAFSHARAKAWVPEGQWDCVGAQLPASMHELARRCFGQRLNLETAEHYFGERATWDWRKKQQG